MIPLPLRSRVKFVRVARRIYARAFRIFSIISSQCTSRLSEINFSRTHCDLMRDSSQPCEWCSGSLQTAVYNNIRRSHDRKRRRAKGSMDPSVFNDQLGRASRLAPDRCATFASDLHALTPLITTPLITCVFNCARKLFNNRRSGRIPGPYVLIAGAKRE